MRTGTYDKRYNAIYIRWTSNDFCLKNKYQRKIIELWSYNLKKSLNLTETNNIKDKSCSLLKIALIWKVSFKNANFFVTLINSAEFISKMIFFYSKSIKIILLKLEKFWVIISFFFQNIQVQYVLWLRIASYVWGT